MFQIEVHFAILQNHLWGLSGFGFMQLENRQTKNHAPASCEIGVKTTYFADAPENHGEYVQIEV